jgi:hypothetical protein
MPRRLEHRRGNPPTEDDGGDTTENQGAKTLVEILTPGAGCFDLCVILGHARLVDVGGLGCLFVDGGGGGDLSTALLCMCSGVLWHLVVMLLLLLYYVAHGGVRRRRQRRCREGLSVWGGREKWLWPSHGRPFTRLITRPVGFRTTGTVQATHAELQPPYQISREPIIWGP